MAPPTAAASGSASWCISSAATAAGASWKAGFHTRTTAVLPLRRAGIRHRNAGVASTTPGLSAGAYRWPQCSCLCADATGGQSGLREFQPERARGGPGNLAATRAGILGDERHRSICDWGFVPGGLWQDDDLALLETRGRPRD